MKVTDLPPGGERGHAYAASRGWTRLDAAEKGDPTGLDELSRSAVGRVTRNGFV